MTIAVITATITTVIVVVAVIQAPKVLEVGLLGVVAVMDYHI